MEAFASRSEGKHPAATPREPFKPLDNSIVLFPSRCVHGVTLVEVDPTDFGTGRFSVNGALRTRRTDGC